MRKVVFALWMLILCPSIGAEGTETQQVLERLDAVIAQKESYRSRKEAKIGELSLIGIGEVQVLQLAFL